MTLQNLVHYLSIPRNKSRVTLLTIPLTWFFRFQATEILIEMQPASKQPIRSLQPADCTTSKLKSLAKAETVTWGSDCRRME